MFDNYCYMFYSGAKVRKSLEFKVSNMEFFFILCFFTFFMYVSKLFSVFHNKKTQLFSRRTALKAMNKSFC